MKKDYQKPTIKVFFIECQQSLAGSISGEIDGYDSSTESGFTQDD